MKNTYQDDYPSKTPKKAPSSPNVSKVPTPGAVRPAKQAPPPIKKSVVQKPPVATDGTHPPVGYPPGYYTQPVFYQPDPSQPPQAFPVYYAPYPPAPFVPGAYPQPQQPPSDTATPPSPAESSSNEAGTRVLFQSEDFDKKDDSSREHRDYPKKEYNLDFDLTEEHISSKKRAPSATKKTASDFKVDEMEIGTYEFNIMTAGQSSKSKSVLTPDEEEREMGLREENYIDEIIEETEENDDVEIEDVPEKEENKLPTGEIIRRAVLGISILAIIIACASLLNEYRLHKQNKDLMSDLSDMIITQASTTESATDNGPTDKNTSTTVPTTLPLYERPLTVEEQWEALRAENPNIVFPEGLQLKYAKLYAQNTDFVGYLSAPGSELDTPVVQGEDDKEYVEKNFYGESTKYACPFVTSTNNIHTLDENTVIFGHHMRDGSIFGHLDQYRTLDGYKKAPVINFDTIYGNYSFKVIATMITNINPKHDNGYVFTYYWTNLNNEINHSAYLNQLSQRSLYDTGVDVYPTDKLLTLSTCCKDFDDARLVVVARLVRPGESTEVDTSRAIKNENPRYPQAYYDKKNKKNPYADAYKWQIS